MLGFFGPSHAVVSVTKNNMSKGKKNFFYNPSYRANIYMIAWAFIECFKLIGLLSPKCREIVENAENDQVRAAAAMGFTSALIFVFMFIFFVHSQMVWSIKKIAMFFFLYILIGLMGWLSIT